MSWWELAGTASVAAGILTAAIAAFLVLTCPSPYSPVRPRLVTEAAFDDEARQTPHQSGYASFQKHKDAHGRLEIEASAQVVVLGDIGRSPRMQYHALSIAQHGGIVDVIGYTGAELHPEMVQSRMINIVPLRPPPPQLHASSRLLFLLLAPLKVLWQVGSLYHALCYRSAAAKWMLVQNPPSIPALAVCQAVCFLRRTRLVIDWHNFGYTMLALKLGARHPLVKVSEWYERVVSARGVHAHLAVTDAMCRALAAKWAVHHARPLHDRPADIYRPLGRGERDALLRELPATSPYADDLARGARRLLVSPTSWTPDEDFSILLDALVRYSRAVALSPPDRPLPGIVAIITGRGPQRDRYRRKIQSLADAGQLDHCIVTTAWLSPLQYARLLGSADLGVSLHTSSSGVDLPMKVVDMFGAGLPVAGWGNFEAWPELVTEGKNGKGFASAEGLAEILESLFGGDGVELRRLRSGAMEECERRWNDEWMPVAGKLFQLST